MTIDMNDFLTIVNNSSSTLNIIDIRSKYIYDLSHINNSINVPYDSLLLSPSKYLNKNDTYYLYCQAGYTSKSISKKLNSLGYKTISINGGYNSYRLNIVKDISSF